jgi:carotenoid cleavage dioxygenase
MPRIASKDFMRDYEIGYYESFDPTNAPPLIAGPVGAGFNTIQRLNVKTGELRRLPMDQRSTLEEAIHIPSKQPGHEGYLAFAVDLHDVMGSEVWVVDAAHPEKGAMAKIKLPLRLRPQVHGNWVNQEEF